MKILHTADWHLGKRLNDYSRLDEQRLVLEEICQIADKQAVDLVLIAGDIYDTFNPPTEATELLYKTLRKLSKDGQRPVVLIAGNHDSPDRIEAPDPLARELGIIFYGNLQSSITPFSLDNGLAVTASESGFIRLEGPQLSSPVNLILAPYANELLLKTFLGEENREAELRTQLSQRWQKLADKYFQDDQVNLFMGHLFFMKEGEKPQEEPESERSILHIGGAQAIFSNLIPQKTQYAALGHLHRYQVIDRDPCPVVYSSSPLCYSFSEAGQEKCVVIVSVVPHETAQLDKIALKQGKALVRKRFESSEEALIWLESNQDSFVELTLVTDEAISAQTRKALYQMHQGIVSLIPELKSYQSNAKKGLEAADLGQDIRELFKKYYIQQNGQEPHDDLMNILNEVLAKDAS